MTNPPPPTYRLAQVTDPEGHAVSYAYDADGNRISRTSALGISTRFAYDALDRRIAVIRNADSGLSADHQTNVRTEYGYDLAGNLIRLTNPLGYQAEFSYDAAHRRTEAVDFEGGSTLYSYDKVDNLLSITDAEGNPTLYQYDDLNRRISSTNAEDETTGFVYDLMGNRITLIEADETLTRYEHDGVYRLHRVTENYRPDEAPGNDVNKLTRYSYDARGLLTEIINANEAATAFAYNGVGNLIEEINPLGRTWTYSYDGMGNRISRRDGKGALTAYSFYPDDLLQSIAYSDGTAVSYAYDADNRRIQMQDWLGQTSWDYDPLARVTGTVDPLGSVLAASYDAAGNRTSLTYPDSSVAEYAYSPNNWMQQIIAGDTGTRHAVSQQTQYSRNRVGRVTGIINSNATRTDIAYDRVYRTLRRETVNRKETIAAFEYAYNPVGHVTEAVKEYGWRNPTQQRESYSYDGLHRLAGVVINPLKNNGDPVQMGYAYDPVGNRLSWSSEDDLATNQPWDGFTITSAYNAANQLLRAETDSLTPNPNRSPVQEFRYDGNGNRIRVQADDGHGPVIGTDYSYDPENRLIQALDYQLTGSDAGNRIDRAVTALEYDGGGRRLVKHYDPKANQSLGSTTGGKKGGKKNSTGAGTQGVDKRTEYVFDGLDPVAEYDTLNGQYENYYRGTDRQISMAQHFNSGATGQLRWYHYNHKGDVAGLTKQNGNAVHTYRYDPYGGVIPANGNFTDPHNHYTLTGKEFDEHTGLVWFGARHYDPETGVWMGQDTYRGRLNDPASLHRFMYVDDNPVTFWDWYGYATKGEIERVKSVIDDAAKTYGVPVEAIAILLDVENPSDNNFNRQVKQLGAFALNPLGLGKVANRVGNSFGMNLMKDHCRYGCPQGVGNISPDVAQEISDYFDKNYPSTKMSCMAHVNSFTRNIKLTNDYYNVYIVAASIRRGMEELKRLGVVNNVDNEELTKKELSLIIQYHNYPASSVSGICSTVYCNRIVELLNKYNKGETGLQFIDN
ncbi:MAG: RHS repeat-associated core domain-containing protein [Candidatus Electrothrix sp. GW3-4]|uniref:RHS repeat-associated core domain-containing protein n=1 Tax=Candidatus Electrothrix sp. GW3-4 TaxID=3126740 RepID=UPI0030D33CA4